MICSGRDDRIEKIDNIPTQANRELEWATFSYRSRGEKSVSAIKVESIFSANLPFASDSSFTRFHSGSSWNDLQLAVAASRLGC